MSDTPGESNTSDSVHIYIQPGWTPHIEGTVDLLRMLTMAYGVDYTALARIFVAMARIRDDHVVVPGPLVYPPRAVMCELLRQVFEDIDKFLKDHPGVRRCISSTSPPLLTDRARMIDRKTYVGTSATALSTILFEIFNDVTPSRLWARGTSRERS